MSCNGIVNKYKTVINHKSNNFVTSHRCTLQ